MKSLNLALVVVLVAFTPACSGDGNNGNDGGNGNDSGNTNDSGSGNDSGNTNDSGSGNDSGSDTGAPMKANFGSVSFTQTETKIANNTTESYAASAAFYETPDGGVASGCSGTQSGSCCYVPSGGTTPTFTAVSAGGITLKDGSTTIGTMTPNGTTYTPLDSLTTSSLKWNAGDTLNVSAAGDTVHAFNGNVSAVAVLEGLNPAFGATAIALSKSADFTETWTAGTGAITLVVSQQNHGTISCTSATDSGTMTVPHALLGNFNTGAASISLTREISADASSDNATITLTSGNSQAAQANVAQ